ncbi:MAG: hypothetical protein Q9219_007357 [cf. Caloplaca sp. 3 TL-2023]
MRDAKCTPRRARPESMNDRQVPWTEEVARHRPRAPVRRLSASEETRPLRQGVRPRRSNFGREVQEEEDEDDTTVFIRSPAAEVPPTKMSRTIRFALNPDASPNGWNHDHAHSPQGYDYTSSKRTPDAVSSCYQQRAYAIAEEMGAFSDLSEEEGPMKMRIDEELRHAFAVHALNQGYGRGLRNDFASSVPETTGTTPGSGTRLRLTVRPRTLIYGHKAGLWLKDFSWESFCGLAQALMIHDWQTFEYPEIDEKKKFTVEVENREGNNRYSMTLLHSNSRKTYQLKILPFIRGDGPKPRVRVLTAKNTCSFDCDCDDSREIEVEAVDMGFLTMYAPWHLWQQKEKFGSNTKVFEITMFDLLFPSPAFNEYLEFDMEFPDGTVYRLERGMEPFLGLEVQQHLSRITTREREPGVKAQRIKLWPVWAIKVFDSIRVFHGIDTKREPEFWDMAALKRVNLGKDDMEEESSIPPKSIMDDLAAISKKLLDIDPRVSHKGIVLHVIRNTPTGGKTEWLHWGPKHTFVRFMLEVLYKIDNDAIAIYPGDHEDSEDSTVMRMKETVEAFRQKRILDQAVQVLYQKPKLPVLGEIPPFSTGREMADHSIPTDTPLSLFPARTLPTTQPPNDPRFDAESLRRRLNRAENKILLREESCKVCGITFDKSSPAVEAAIREHYRSHAAPPPRSCPLQGCEEDLENRTRYPSYQQYSEHSTLHPTIIYDRTTAPTHHPNRDNNIFVQPSSPAARRTAITTTTTTTTRANAPPTQKEWQEPKPRSNDSMTDIPGEHSKRLVCDICHHIMDELDDKERATHARDCKTSVANFGTLMLRPGKAMAGLDQEMLLRRYKRNWGMKDAVAEGEGGDMGERTEGTAGDGKRGRKRTGRVTAAAADTITSSRAITTTGAKNRKRTADAAAAVAAAVAEEEEEVPPAAVATATPSPGIKRLPPPPLPPAAASTTTEATITNKRDHSAPTPPPAVPAAAAAASPPPKNPQLESRPPPAPPPPTTKRRKPRTAATTTAAAAANDEPRQEGNENLPRAPPPFDPDDVTDLPPPPPPSKTPPSRKPARAKNPPPTILQNEEEEEPSQTQQQPRPARKPARAPNPTTAPVPASSSAGDGGRKSRTTRAEARRAGEIVAVAAAVVEEGRGDGEGNEAGTVVAGGGKRKRRATAKVREAAAVEEDRSIGGARGEGRRRVVRR